MNAAGCLDFIWPLMLHLHILLILVMNNQSSRPFTVPSLRFSEYRCGHCYSASYPFRDCESYSYTAPS